MLSPEYVAGLFDGEGTVGLYLTPGCKDARYKSGRRGPAWVRIASLNGCYKPTIEALHAQFGGSFKLARPAVGTNKTHWHWGVGSTADIKRFLLEVLPYLREKREQAELMLVALGGGIPMDKAADMLREMKKVSHE